MITSLPFCQDIDTSLGILFKSVIEETSLPSLSEKLSQTFPFVENVKAELVRGFHFWRHLVRVVTFIHEHREIGDPFYAEVVAADKWFSGIMKNVFDAIGIK